MFQIDSFSRVPVYEQIINQLFEENISSIDRTRFYIGERFVEKSEVAKLLSMYLTNIFEQILSNAEYFVASLRR